MFSRKLVRKFSVSAAAVAVALGVAVPTAGAVQAKVIEGGGVVLPGCAVTLVPEIGQPQGAVCLMAAEVTTAADVPGPCETWGYVKISEHGPVEAPSGWGKTMCKQHGGVYRFDIPESHDNHASAWWSVRTCGDFHPNDGNGSPWQPFSRDRSGNFPWGIVGNDDLESVSMQDCAE